jgi:tRNA1Val (adenine37-N6)-methyltransferase
MKRPTFRFKQFTVRDADSAMKLSTDAVLLGAFADLTDARSILDIGTGCGILALMAAQKSNATITAIEPDASSVSDAGINFKSSPWNNRLALVQKNLQDFTAEHPDKFDHILSNPPFFSRNLLSPDPFKNLAKHDRYLTLEELFRWARILLTDSGKFSLILPFTQLHSIDQYTLKNGFYKTRILKIIPTPKKPVNRILLELQLKTRGPTLEQSLMIRTEKGNYTPEYKLFTGDFYLNL